MKVTKEPLEGAAGWFYQYNLGPPTGCLATIRECPDEELDVALWADLTQDVLEKLDKAHEEGTLPRDHYEAILQQGAFELNWEARDLRGQAGRMEQAAERVNKHMQALRREK